jgi:hypothetical protein
MVARDCQQSPDTGSGRVGGWPSMKLPNGFDFVLASLPDSAGGRERSDPKMALSKKLRVQAERNGLKPGSPRWRAYVLGGMAASAKRRQEKSESRAKQKGLKKSGCV